MSISKIKSKGISVRWKLAVYMSVFVAIVLLVMWMFHVFLLDTFFRSVKKSEMEETADLLESKIGAEDLESAAYSEAADHSLCVMIFRIDESTANEIVNVDATGSNLIMSISSERLGHFYRKAHENGGSCFSRITFGGFEVAEDELIDKLPFQNENGGNKIPTKNIRMVYVRLTQTAENESYMILLDASVQPLDSTVRTLMTQ